MKNLSLHVLLYVWLTLTALSAQANENQDDEVGAFKSTEVTESQETAASQACPELLQNSTQPNSEPLRPEPSRSAQPSSEQSNSAQSRITQSRSTPFQDDPTLRPVYDRWSALSSADLREALLLREQPANTITAIEVRQQIIATSTQPQRYLFDHQLAYLKGKKNMLQRFLTLLLAKSGPVHFDVLNEQRREMVILDHWYQDAKGQTAITKKHKQLPTNAPHREPESTDMESNRLESNDLKPEKPRPGSEFFTPPSNAILSPSEWIEQKDSQTLKTQLTHLLNTMQNTQLEKDKLDTLRKQLVEDLKSFIIPARTQLRQELAHLDFMLSYLSLLDLSVDLDDVPELDKTASLLGLEVNFDDISGQDKIEGVIVSGSGDSVRVGDAKVYTLDHLVLENRLKDHSWSLQQIANLSRHMERQLSRIESWEAVIDTTDLALKAGIQFGPQALKVAIGELKKHIRLPKFLKPF